MKQISMNDLLREDGTFDYQRYQKAADNWAYGRIQGDGLLNQKHQQNTEMQKVNIKGKDSVFISEEGMKMLHEMQNNRVNTDDMEYIDPLEYRQNMTGVVTYIAGLSEVGEAIWKSGRNGAEAIGSAYDILRGEIENRYNAPDYKPAIVVEEDGVTAHLMTKEEELAILDEAYENIAEFKAVSAREMERFKGGQLPQEAYEKTKQAYLAAREARNMEKLKEKVDSVSADKDNLQKSVSFLPVDFIS